MKINKTAIAVQYFTKNHDWVTYDGLKAFVGVSGFKLLGFREILSIVYHQTEGMVTKGQLIATIRCNTYVAKAFMPVDGTIEMINKRLLHNPILLLRHPETEGWIASITPMSPYDRIGLLTRKEYQTNGRSKYAK